MAISEPNTQQASLCERPAASRESARAWLNTPDWLLVNATPADAGLFAELHARNGDHFRPAMAIEPRMDTPGFWAPILEAQQKDFLAGNSVTLVGFHKAALRPEIGCVISFSGIVHDEFETCWLGYRLDRKLEGRGLMHAALVPAIAAMFARYRLHRIMASHQPENLRSGRLLRRLGFGIEGYARDYMKINGRWHDNVLLALLAPGC